MKFERDNFHVVTGGSGSGKSTIIATLKARGFLCAEEAGRQLVQEQVRIGGDATPWQDPIKFRDALLARSIHIFEQVPERNRPVFFDRGIPDVVGYARFLQVPVPAITVPRSHCTDMRPPCPLRRLGARYTKTTRRENRHGPTPSPTIA